MRPAGDESQRPSRWAKISLIAVAGLAATAGLALAPAASAAAANTPSAVPRAITYCEIFGVNTYSREASCAGTAPSQFRVWILCNDGTRVNGPWRTAGAGIPSYAQCGNVSRIVSIFGINTES